MLNLGSGVEGGRGGVRCVVVHHWGDWGRGAV
jgi:hypothetical protein